MFLKKSNFEKNNQLKHIKFLFGIQNSLIKFNWGLMEDYKKTKKVDYVDTMNLIQDAINSLNKAQLKSSKVSMDQNVISIKNTNIHSKKS